MLLSQKVYLLLQSSLRNSSKEGPREKKIMKTLSTRKGYVLSLIRKIENPLMDKKLKRISMMRVTNPSKRSNNFPMRLLKTTKT
jgi:hypothetical protein